jgi:hypothetical protein
MTLTPAQAKEKLDAHVRETIEWHFNPQTGSPFWVDAAAGKNPLLKLGFDPRKEVKSFDDLKKFGLFEDDWLRGGPVRRWLPRALWNRPTYVFETGGTTGIPKSRVVVDDFRIDYEMFSETLPEQNFPKGANWLMLGPSGPRRLRLAVEHLCQHRGGICFCVDLDPRWVIKLIKKGWMDHLKAYQEHVIDQALTVLSAGHEIKCMFTTPKLLDALAGRLEKEGSSIAQTGITGIFCGGTEMTSQWIRFAIEELIGHRYLITPAALDGMRKHGVPESVLSKLDDLKGKEFLKKEPLSEALGEQLGWQDADKYKDAVLERSCLGPLAYIAPTYGNTLMGLAASDMPKAEENYKIAYYAPQPRAAIQVVDFDNPDKVVAYGQTGRVMLTTLTRELFIPRFLERDEGEREPPSARYPWDGISGVRPFHGFAATTTVGVY